MQCPKCGHQQEQTINCATCGVYFEKLALQTKRQAPTKPVTYDLEESQGGIRPRWILVGIAAALAGYFYFGQQQSQPTKPANRRVVTAVATSTSAIDGETAKRLAASHPPRNPIEAARNATIFIKTDWGSQGSGFIINAGCDAVTNRHVVEFDARKISTYIQHRPDFQSKLLVAQTKMEFSLQQLKAIYAQVLAQEGNSTRARDLKQKIESLEADLAALPQKIDQEVTAKVSDEAWRAEAKGFTAVLIDGTEYPAIKAQYAPDSDLALFHLPAEGCPYLDYADSRDLQQGQRLYTIGSPSGLTYSVTSGIFSGFRDVEQHHVLQTDAPINPGNSGGPLINESGKVVGINTSVLRDTQGIGFAIPIETVGEEFPGLR
jgi:serine protease Do